MFKYFIDIPFIPISNVTTSRYKKSVSQLRQPSIIKECKPGVYEIDDIFLFYCEAGEYEYMVYTFDIFRVVKYRNLNTNQFKFCIKSSSEDLGIYNNLSFNAAISSSVINKFNSNLYIDVTNPIFIIKKNDAICCDLISDNGTIKLSLGNTNSFITLGESKIPFHAKTLTQFSNPITVEIFDVYKTDGLLRMTYLERYKIIEQIISHIKTPYISASKIINQADINDQMCVIIIDDDNLNYMEWSKPSFNAQVIQNNLILNDGTLDDYFKTTQSHQGEIVKVQSDMSVIVNYNCIKTDKFTLFKFAQNKELNSIEFLKKTLSKTIQNINKRTIIKNYSAGKTLIISNYLIAMPELEYTEVKTMPEILDYHTIVIDNIDVKLPDNFNGKVVKFNKDDSWEIKDAGEKTFVFLLGIMGSGKSVLIKKVRSLLNMSGGVFIAQIDKLVENDIEFIVDPSNTVYKKLRTEIYNDHMDQLIGQSIMGDNSIILETTNINPDYVTWLKQYGYKTIAVVIDESYENISTNISIRNLTKLRKTALDYATYEEFQKKIPGYLINVDQVITIKPDH